MATPKKLPSGNWRCLVYIGKDKNGKNKYKSVTAESRKACITKAALITDKPKKEQKITVREAVEQNILIRKDVLSPATVRGYYKILRCNLTPIADIPVSELTAEDMQQLVNSMVRSLSVKTIQNALGLLRPSLKGFVSSDIFDITLPQKKPTDIQIPSRETAAKLEQAISGLEIELPVLLAMQCGLRMSEVLGIKKSDADFVNRTLTVRRAIVINEVGVAVEKAPKSYCGNRTIPMPGKVAELLEKADENGYAVKLTAISISKRLDTVMKKAGIPHIRFHDLRHYYASVCLLLNMPERYAMEFMGHSTPGMLKKYQHIMDDEKKRLGDQLSNYFN